MKTMVDRRDTLKLLMAGAAAFGLGWPKSAAAQSADATEWTLTQAAAAIRDRKITSLELANAFIERAERLSELGAFINFDPQQVRAAAQEADRKQDSGAPLGPLHGVPIAIKDNIDVVGYPTTAGTPGLAGNKPTRNAPVAAALLDAGAIVIGKNNMHELAFGATSNNAAFGPVHNPYDRRMIPGGSSGGTATAVAARMAPAGIGTDTGGSVRVPASLCGLSGLRPTVKRWPQTGIVPIASTRDTAGPMARSFDDLALLDGIVTGAQTTLAAAPLNEIRLGVPRGYYWAGLDEGTSSLSEAALRTLADHGVTLVEADVTDLAALNAAVSFTVALYEPRIDIPAYLKAGGQATTLEEIARSVVSPDVAATMKILLDPKTAIREADYVAAHDHNRYRLIEAYSDYFAAHRLDAIIYPMTPLTARPIGEDETVQIGANRVPTFTTFIRNSDPGSNAGIPGITLPIGLAPDGLPVGLGLEGPTGTDRRLLAVGKALSALFAPPPAPTV